MAVGSGTGRCSKQRPTEKQQVALDRRRLARVWRRIHQLNYVIFVAVFVKAIVIGSDVITITPTAEAMKGLLILYMALATLATALRVTGFRRARAAARAEA